MKRAVTRAAAGVTVTVATLAVLTGPAAAEASPSGCPKGNFCLWYEGQDKPFWSEPGDMREPVGTWRPDLHIWAFNNGRPQPGWDHVRVYWHYKYFDGRDTGDEHLNVTCFHYNPGPGRYKGAIGGNSPDKVTHIHKAVWGPEC
ncbi:hypothetical protein [Nonomuraea basaltis]|uniref:hypothetical protein n=1 Tax=Nonomuraea basaltis TaxID=2495887 RepID=UPI00110C53CC|nr:hypothetical protein [Nonomuraea basaltis]TMR89427.1 hypothetical protein EJK15_60875 [Nonomuraea basaltis]